MAQNLVSFYKGTQAALPNSYSEGSLYITTDKPALYLDVNNSSRIKISDFTIVEKLSDLPSSEALCKTKFYFVNEDNTIATWSQSMGSMVRINIDTGATAARLKEDSTGNAVTNITYDERNREIIFEKGLAFVTEEKIGSLDGLTTVNKNNLVSAINEINAALVEGVTGIKNLYLDESGNLICVLTDDSEINAGKIPNYNDITLINCGNANN